VSRIFLITLGYVPNKLFKHTAARLCETLSGKHEIERLFIAKPYPVNVEENLQLNICTARKYGYRVIERETDLGAAGDFNLTLQQISLLDDDLVFICDHDVFHVEHNWDDAMIRVMRADPQIDWVCLWNNNISDLEFGERGGVPGEKDGVRFIEAIVPMMAVTSLIRGSFLNYTHGLIQPSKYYGGVEIGMWGKLKERGTKQVFLRDFTEDQRLKEHEDLEYRAWKTQHATGRYKGSFADYLEIRK
jgi:hypothetical protein